MSNPSPLRLSDSIKEIAIALAKAQSKIEHALKTSENIHFTSKYADLAAVMDACRGPLTENGLSFFQSPTLMTDHKWVLITRLLHTSGEWIENDVPIMNSQGSAQSFGSALTYARRQGLTSLVGIAQDDDDGNAASAKSPSQKTQPKQAEKKPDEPKKPPFIPFKPPEGRALSAEEKVNLSRFVVTGGKFKGKALGDIPFDDIMSYRNWYYNEYPEGGAKPHPTAQDLLVRINCLYADQL